MRRLLAFLLGALLCWPAWAQQVPHPTNGPATSTLNKLACYKNTSGSSLGECDANDVIPQRLLLSNSLTGDLGGALVGGFENITDTTGAINYGIGKINSIYAVNKFGGGGTNAKEGQRAGIFAKVQQDGPIDYTGSEHHFHAGTWSWLEVNQGNTAVGQDPQYYGFAGLVELRGTDTRAQSVYGVEVDVGFGPTVVVGNRIGVMASIGAGNFTHSTPAIYYDGAFAIGRNTAEDASWKTGYTLRAPHGVWAFNSASTLFGGLGTNNSAGGVAAVAWTGIDLTGITFGSAEYVSDHFKIDAYGSLHTYGPYPHYKMQDTSGLSTLTGGGLTRWTSVGSNNWEQQINTAAAGDFSTGLIAWRMAGATGGVGFGAEVKLKEKQVAALPTCDLGSRASLYQVTDANAPTYGAALVGGGATWAIALCDGAVWRAH